MSSRPILLLVLVAASACELAPDRVASWNDDPPSETDSSMTLGDSTGDDPSPESGSEPPTCEGDCPCAAPQCTQFCTPDFPEFCAMECPPGSFCSQSCEQNYCSSDCFEGSICSEQCLVGACVMDCHGAADCGIECMGMLPCAMTCESTGTCHMSCPLGNCSIYCLDSNCSIEVCPFGCTILCGPGSACECADPGGCTVQNV